MGGCVAVAKKFLQKQFKFHSNLKMSVQNQVQADRAFYSTLLQSAESKDSPPLPRFSFIYKMFASAQISWRMKLPQKTAGKLIFLQMCKITFGKPGQEVYRDGLGKEMKTQVSSRFSPLVLNLIYLFK